MCDHDIALHCLRTLSNSSLSKRNLIIDFALEDQRKLFKREKKFENFSKHKKDAERKGPNKKQKEGKKDKEKTVKKERKLSDIQDPGELKSLMKSCKSRGKKQRIKKRLLAMGEIQPPVKKEEIKKENEGEAVKKEGGEEPKLNMGGKRRAHEENREVERDIMKARKQKKQKKRDQVRSKTDKFDVSFVMLT